MPQTALPEQAFMLNSWVYAPTEQEIDYRLTRNGTVISAGKRKVTAGLSRLLFRDRAGSARTIEYRLGGRFGLISSPNKPRSSAKPKL